MVELSIIIPSLNEEKYLPKLLDSIKKQSYKDYEIIVADAGSKDDTVKIAKEYGCKVIKGGLPAKGRNKGARVSNGSILMFVDADFVLPNNNFIDDTVGEIKERKLDVATSYHKLLSNKISYRFIELVIRALLGIGQYISPYAIGFIIAKKDLHNKNRGFDETIKIAEDHNYVKRAFKIGKFRILKSKILASTRRYDKEGKLKLCLEYTYIFIYRLILGEMKNMKFSYFKE